MLKGKKTASYKIVSAKNGNRYQFFCDLSGALVCTTKPFKEDDPEKELILAWETEGKSQFNVCNKCGRWVVTAMFNPEVLNCVQCSPFEDIPEYCPKCGEHVEDSERDFCTKCGARLLYGGESHESDG